MKSLTADDMYNLKFYVESELFNTNKKINILYNIIINYPKGRGLNELALYDLICVTQKISRVNYRMLLGDFSNLIETYIAHSAFHKDSIRGLEYLLMYSFENNLHFLLKKTISKLESYFEKRIDLNLREKFVKIEYLLISSLISQGENKKLKEAETSLFYELQLKNITQLNKKTISKVSKTILGEVDNSLKDIKRMDLYTYFYYLLYKIKYENVREFLEIEKIFNNTNSTELKNLISEYIVNNFEIKLEDQLKFVKWYWFNASKRNKLLNIDRLLIVALKSNDVELSKHMVKYLKTTNVFNKGYFSLALYYFYFNEYSECLDELEKITPEDIETDAQIRQLKMCCFVRMNQLKSFSNAFFAYKKSILANKTSQIIKETTKFCQILFQIINNKSNLDRLLNVQNALIKEDIINKDWLLSELNYHIKKSSK